MAAQLERFFRFGLRLDDKHRNERQYGARDALLVLTSINLLNYADRYVPSAVKQLIIDDLGISDFESSLPTTSMIVTYMIFAVIFGYLSDRQLVDRRVSYPTLQTRQLHVLICKPCR
jgi:MFS family permease